MQRQKIKAFTLVELIVVITILAILGTIWFIAYSGYSSQARDSVRVWDLQSMKSSLELYQLDSWKYPLPSDWVNITYSWTTVWNQWTFWEKVKTNVWNISIIPKDPLTDKEYTYSTLSYWNEFELWWMLESDEFVFNTNSNSLNLSYFTSKSNAAETTALAYVTWKYNWEIAKSLTWSTCNIFNIPSIITNDTSVTDLQQIVTQKKLVYRWYNNLPSSFKTSKFKYDWWFDFTPNQLIAYSDTWSCSALIDKSSYSARVSLLNWIHNAYSWTLVQNEWEIKNILDLVINESSPSLDVLNFSASFVNRNFWWYVEISYTPISVNWVCWTDNWKNLTTTPVNLCTWWNATSVTDNWAWNTYTWSCNWVSWGSNISCTANHVTSWTSYTTANWLAWNTNNQSVSQDNSWNIWVANWWAWVSKYNWSTWTVYTTSNWLINNYVWSVVKDNSWNMWFWTNGGVSKYNWTTFTNYTTVDWLVDNYINVVFKDSSWNIWFWTNGGVSKYNWTTFTNYNTWNWLVNNIIMAIWEDSSWNIWFWSASNWLSKFNWTTFTTFASWNSWLVNNSIRAIWQWWGTDIWIGTTNWLSRFDWTTWTTYTQANTSNLLAYNHIFSIIKDTTWNMWIWCANNWLSKFDGSAWTKYTTSNWLIDNNILSVFQDSDLNYWFWTNWGVTRYIP